MSKLKISILNCRTGVMTNLLNSGWVMTENLHHKEGAKEHSFVFEETGFQRIEKMLNLLSSNGNIEDDMIESLYITIGNKDEKIKSLEKLLSTRNKESHHQGVCLKECHESFVCEERKVDRLRDENRLLNNDLEEHQDQINGMLEAIDDKDKIIKKTQQLLISRNKEIKGLKEANISYFKDIDELEAFCRSLSDVLKVKDFQSERTIKNLGTTISEANERQVELQSEYDELDDDFDEYRRVYKESKTASCLSIELKRCKQKLNSSVDEVDRLSNLSHMKNKEINSLIEERDGLKWLSESSTIPKDEFDELKIFNCRCVSTPVSKETFSKTEIQCLKNAVSLINEQIVRQNRALNVVNEKARQINVREFNNRKSMIDLSERLNTQGEAISIISTKNIIQDEALGVINNKIIDIEGILRNLSFAK